MTDALLARGAPIQEVNTLRKQLDVVKGGGLGQAAAPAQVVSFILSDVVGDPLDIIASGPTVANPGTLQDALEVIDRYELSEFIPSTVYEGWQSASPAESQSFSAHNLIIANNATAIDAAIHQAQLEAYQAQRMPTPFEGEARELGLEFAEQLEALAASVEERPLLLIVGGESTVTLQGDGLVVAIRNWPWLPSKP